MAQSNINTLIISGTVRQNRSSSVISQWYMNEAAAVANQHNMELKLLEVADLGLPLFSEAIPPMAHQYGDIQKRLAKEIEWADAFVFITGEYNHSVPGSLKNFMDFLYAEWNRKVAGFVGYGNHGGARAIEHLAAVLSELRTAPLTSGGTTVNIHAPWEAFDSDGKPKEGYVRGSVEKQLAELSWWASALKRARSA